MRRHDEGEQQQKTIMSFIDEISSDFCGKILENYFAVCYNEINETKEETT